MSKSRKSPPPPALPDNDDMLEEILLRLPPLPSSLPRAALVCKRWRRLVCDPQFLRRFRAHHRTPPLLGFFHQTFTGPVFVPMLEPPDRIPPARFSLPEHTDSAWTFLGCRHGLAAFLNLNRMEAVVWNPMTGSQCRIPFPPGVKFGIVHYIFVGGVLSASSDYGDGYVDSDPHLSPFKLVLLFNNAKKNLACACVYESGSGKWGNISSVPFPSRPYLLDSGVLVGNALFCLCWDGDILEFDLDYQSLSIIQKPEEARFASMFRVLGTEERELCFAIISRHSMQLWGRKADSNGTIRWVLNKTVVLDQLLSVKPSKQSRPTRIMGFDDDGDVIFLLIADNIFTIQLDSLQFEKHQRDGWIPEYYPYRSFYAAG